MPTDPDSRRDKKLEDIFRAIGKTNDLLSAQNKILEKMERYGRPQPIVQHHPYLERSDGNTAGTDAGNNAGDDPSPA